MKNLIEYVRLLCSEWIFIIIFTFIISITHSRLLKINGAWSDFWYQSNSNISVYLGNIIIYQKYFFHILLLKKNHLCVYTFSIWTHFKNNLLFTIWVMFWNISRLFVFFFSIRNIKNNCYIIFLKYFRVIFFWWKIYSFPVIFTYKKI